jgi:hypothetical protein
VTPDDIRALLKVAGTAREALSRNALGYPSKTAEARLEGGSGRPGPIVPNGIAWNRRIGAITRAVRHMPRQMREYVHAAYWTNASQREMASYFNCDRRTLKRIDDQAVYWCMGFLSRN